MSDTNSAHDMPSEVKDILQNDPRPWWNKEVLEWFAKQDKCAEEIATELGCHKNTIRKHAKKHDVSLPEKNDFEWKPAVYVLRLENDNYYVGASKKLDQRIDQHFRGEGVSWTQKHKPIEVIDVQKYGASIYWDMLEDEEEKVTIKMMTEHGWQSVRGSKWFHTDLERPPKKMWEWRDDWPKREWLNPSEEEEWLGTSTQRQEKVEELSDIAEQLC